jgi:hypothetical protein
MQTLAGFKFTCFQQHRYLPKPKANGTFPTKNVFTLEHCRDSDLEIPLKSLKKQLSF